MASTPNYEVDNILNINNNNKITAKQYQSHHSEHSSSVNGGINENILPELSDKQGAEVATTASTVKTPATPSMKEALQRTASETGVAYSMISNTMKPSTRTSTEPSALMTSKSKGEGSRIGKYCKVNGTTSQLPSNATNSNVDVGSYHCQFCDKSFPRLGYLKKHEQVSNELFTCPAYRMYKFSIVLCVTVFVFFLFFAFHTRKSVNKWTHFKWHRARFNGKISS